MPPEEAQPPDSPQPESTPGGRFSLPLRAGRAVVAWSVANRLRAGLLVGAGLVSVAAAVCAWLVIASRAAPGEPVTLEMAVEALEAGSYAVAQELAEKLQSQDTTSTEELAGAAFVRGAAAAHEADDTWRRPKSNYYRAAARYLEEARDRGFPPGREAEGLYLLGRSLYLSGQGPASRPILREALKVNPQKKTEIHQLLCGAYLSDPNPRLEQALAENGLCLADGSLPPAARHQGLLQRAEILLRLERIAACVATLEQIPPEADNRAEVAVLRGEVLLHQARALKNKPDATAEEQLQGRDKYQEAIQALRLAQGRDTLGSQAASKSVYLVGICLLEMGEQRAALAQFAQLCNRFPDTPEAAAASFQGAELFRRQGRDKEALTCYRRVLRGVRDPQQFSNRWITLDQLRSAMLTAYEDYLRGQNFEAGLQLTRQLYPLFPRARTTELTAQAYQARGEALLAQAGKLPGEKAEAIRRLGRAQFRHAGGAYGRLAELQVTTRQYPDHLYSAAEAYLRGQDYQNAVRLLREYLKNETGRHAQALLNLGEALLSLGRIDEALETFQQCVEFHGRDLAAFRVRLLASQACLEKGDLAQAETLLQENLSQQYLTPASGEWRDSLFALGELAEIQGRRAEAIRCLEEAVQRYPSCPQALEAQYLIADLYRRSAENARESLKEELKGTTQPADSGQIDELLTQALSQYRQVQAVLSSRRETGGLPPLQQAMLRNCDFAVGDVLVSLRRYEEAVEAYRTATNRYQNHPDVLEAYVRMAAVYRRLDKPLEARSTLEQAKLMLARMKNDAQFQETTNYTPSQWSERLDWLSTL